ncbi:ABC transporter ATP-binding protein [Paenibacillus borealis]|uniref:ABC transporter ATP-binding protein n=1 Tax=Paenibacillus borealis TaxID=160799 RepID=A0ABX3HAR6_PAEBO|nr:ATP-binding cassette domain-containing protein [Paenibacillus borealis]OMD47065.1 ABC transporter ATP-binding protein [Paenibacillus borealis]
MGSKLLLKARGINKTFGSRKVVNNLNLSIETGDIYGFLGPNGAGKTTTIRILLGLISPDSGEVKIDGVSLRTDFKKSISAIGAMIDPAFYTYLSGYDNLRLIANLIPGMNNSNIKVVLDIVGMMERAEDKVKTYSLGMKQRLGIASALLNNPKLIILDEPTNGLDPQGMVEIRELVVHLAKEKGISFLISSHLLVEVEQICYVQSAQCIPQGILVELRNGYASSLNQVMVAQQIPVEAIVPQNDTLEKFFFEIQNRGQRG